MKKLLQIIYISRSTFQPSGDGGIIEPNVARILAKSRLNNRKNGLVGVLYFGDGVFFQCLEGEEGSVNNLLEKLESDTRHRDIKVISKKYINQLSFGDWAMKFAPLDKEITKFLKDKNFKKFDPYLFSGEVINQFLNLLFNIDDGTDGLKLSTLVNIDENSKGIENKTFNNSQLKSNIALTFSIVALVISLITIFLIR